MNSHHTVAKSKRIALALCGAAMLASTAGSASAATTSATMSTSATVTANCYVTTTAISFGSLNVLREGADGTGTFSVECTNGTGWTAAANAGSGTGATMATRKMTAGANTLNYTIYKDSARTVVWGDAADASTQTIAGTGTGSAVSTTVYGSIPSGQNTVQAGSYSDTVTVTLTY